jgi:hypothetical protein
MASAHKVADSHLIANENDCQQLYVTLKQLGLRADKHCFEMSLKAGN